MSKQASASISKAAEPESKGGSFDLAAYLQAKGAIAAVIPAEGQIRTPEQIIKELFALPAPDIRDLYIRAFGDNQPVELTRGASAEDYQFIIRAAYKQVFGNAHLMESERAVEAESQFCSGGISVMEFIRQLAKSDRYRTLFFDRCPNVRFIELNFKHLLGRAPENAAEISQHIKIIANGGFEAEIDSYFESNEYLQNFGTIIVPYHRIFATQADNGLVGFTHLFKLLQGACSSDKSNSIDSSPTLQKSLFGNTASEVNWLSTVPKTAPSVSPFESNTAELTKSYTAAITESYAAAITKTPKPAPEPTVPTPEESKKQEAAIFAAWRNQFDDLLKEEFVADNALETRVSEAGRDATESRAFNVSGFDLATYLEEQAANSKPIPEAKTGPEVASKYTNAFRDRPIVEFTQNNSVEDLDLVVEAAYKQVFGNAYIMESERVVEAESQLRSGRISVMEFVRQIAKSEHYRTIFFDRCTNLRAIELNFKHLLGRAPANGAEISEHIKIIAEEGFEAEIDSYLDSDEYLENFGTKIVPYYRGYDSQTASTLAAYTNSFSILRGACSSDKSTLEGTAPILQQSLLENKASNISDISSVPDSVERISPVGAIEFQSQEYYFPDRLEFPDMNLGIPGYKSPEFLATPVERDQAATDEVADAKTTTFDLASYIAEQEAAKKVEPEVVEETVAPEIASKFTNAFSEIKPFEVIPGASSVEDLDAIIANTYRQVFGNAYLMESERLPIAESKLREGNISVREFVRQLATSEHYRRSFFDKFTNLRAIELNFKHLLGRAPQSYQEISEHIQLIAEGGFTAEINSYLDSDEYQNAYGENIVPFYRGYTSQVGNNLLGYTNSYKLLRGASTSDKASLGGANPRLQSNLIRNNVSPISTISTVPDSAIAFNPLAVPRPVLISEEIIIAKALGLPYVKPEVKPAFPEILKSVKPKQVEPRKDTLDIITKALGLPEPKVVDPITTYIKREAQPTSKVAKIYQKYETLRKENPVEFLPQAISANYVNASNGQEPVMMNGSSGAATDIVIEAAYKQVFGNVHLMESQRLVEAESQLRNREIDVAEFVGKLAKSELHRELFFNNCSNLRAIELNFKHLLGRAPESAQEISEHIEILATGGYEAEIDSYIYSEEYQNSFGSDIVPYVRGFATQTGSNLAAYTHSYELFRGASTSDRSTAVVSGARLQTSLLQGNPSQIHPLSAVPSGAPSVSPVSKVTAASVSSNGHGDSSNLVPFVTAPASAPESVSANHLNAIADQQPVELINSGFGENLDLVIKAAYKQVFGNIHLMESQRLIEIESQLCNGSIDVATFVGKLAKSELYRELFFNNCSNIRAIELNFKHLLGRSPANGQEISEHIQILANGGFDAEIDSYIYGEEYQNTFGSNIVPYFRGFTTQGGDLAGYTHSYELLRGTSSSDRTNNGSKLQTALLANNPSEITPLSCFVPEVEPEVKPKATRPEDLPAYVPLYEPMAKPVGPKAISWQTQYNVLANASPVELIPSSSDQDAEIVIKALYKQVLGNAYVMESERFLVAESQLKSGNLSVREFVRMLAKSDLYKSRFIDNCPRYRSHELNFKHLLGRAPDSYQETIEHSNILDAQGYEADIDSYIDSDEYQNTFGEYIVPYYRGYKSQTGKNLLGYTNMFKMLPSMSTSDKAGLSANSPRLATALIYKNAGGSLPVTDVNDLIRQALKPKAVSTDDSAAIAQLKQKCEQQSKEIESLTSQLKEMEAMSGFAYSSSWKPDVSNDISIVARIPGVYMIPESLQQWRNRSNDLQDEIEELKGKILERRSLAAIAESRLNKWRTRSF
ncbi:MAG: phycobilisome rod-core linker polypeptide [Cyanobacteria bacterium P01_F01_bin.143]